MTTTFTKVSDSVSVPLRVMVEGTGYSDVLASVEVERGLDQFAHSFSFEVIGDDATVGSVQTGMSVVISRGDEVLVTGYVNRVRQTITGTSASLAVEGRSKTADLVDCSATHPKGYWTSSTAMQIITDLCAPFGISVKAGIDNASVVAATKAVFRRFGLQYGETAFQAIDRACKVLGLLPVTDATGNMLLVRKIGSLDLLGSAGGQRFIGRTRIISHERQYDDSDLHSTYQTSVHLASPEDAKNEVGANSGLVKRWRPLVIVPEADQGATSAKTRLVWEANVRTGRAERFHFNVIGSGWSDTESYVPGREYVLPDMFSPSADASGRIASDSERIPAAVLERATIKVTPTSATTDLEFVNPNAYSLEGDTTVNASGLTKAKKPKVIKRRHGRKALVK